MANYTGPKVKLSRRVGVPIADVPKHTTKRQLNPPGQHGFRGRRLRDFGIRLNEKQKLRFNYGVHERHLRKLMEEARQACSKLATLPTKGFGLYKRAINKSLNNSLDEQLELEADLQTEAGSTHDYKEGVQAFMEKRKPEFKGK